MWGHLKKRATGEYVAELGPQPVKRCPASRKRFWIQGGAYPTARLATVPGSWQVRRKKARES
jgi:hypothetical protein